VVPPQVLGRKRRVDDGAGQAIVAVELFGLVAQRVNLGDQIAFSVVTGCPGAAIGVIDLSNEPGQVVVLVTNAAPRGSVSVSRRANSSYLAET
jgi:hypothetical protein